jgi:gas vesicle protein
MADEKRQEQAKLFMFAFLGGAVAGAVGGLLLAPQSGRESREQIFDYAERVRERFRGAVEKGKELVHQQKSMLSGTIGGSHQAVDRQHEDQIKKAS